MKNNYLITTDLKRKVSITTPQLVQYDNVVIQFKIYDNGVALSTEDSTRIEVTNLRPDGVAIVGVGTPKVFDDGIWGLEYIYLGNEMKQAGVNKVSVSIFYEDKKISILPFEVHIIKDLREIAGESSQEDAGLLTQLIESAEEALNTAHEANKIYEQLKEKLDVDLKEIAIATQEAKTATDSSKKQTQEAKNATVNTIKATTDAKNATANANSATTNTIEAIEKAKSQGNTTEQQGNIAEQQGKEAQNIGNKAKQQGNIAEQQGKEAEKQTNIAKEKIKEITQTNTAMQLAKEETIRATENATIQANKAKFEADRIEPMYHALEKELPNIENLKHVGEWSLTKSYKANEEVLYNGSSYRAKQNNTGKTPSSSPADWQLIAQRGVDGKGAVASVNQLFPDLNGNINLGNLVTLENDNITVQQDIQANMKNLAESNLKNIIVTKDFPTGEFPNGTILIIQKDVE